MRIFALVLLFGGQCWAQGRINAGGPAVTDALGQTWAADQYFKGGAVSTGPLPAGAPAYYVTKRYGDFVYTLPVPDGTYTVGLGFLENVAVAVGGRVFNVSINGAVVLPAYDIVADVGLNVPVRKVFTAVAAGGKGISIGFATMARSALVNAIDYSVLPPVPDTVGIHCESGLIAASSFVAALPPPSSAETEIMQLPGNWRFEQVTLCETERFFGQTTITASMGRPGSNNYELTGALVPLGASANNSACWQARPVAPQYTGPYSIVVNIAATTVDPVTGVTLPGDLTQLSAGVLTWEVCGYKASIGDPSVIGMPKVGALKVCSGSGTNSDGTRWDCTGLYQAQIRRADGSLLPLMGPSMVPGVTGPGVTWTDVK